MEISILQKQLGIYIISVGGAIDSTACRELQKKIESIMDPTTKVILLDLSGIEVIDEGSISILSKIDVFLKKNHTRLFIVKPQERVDNIFKISTLLPHIKMLDNIEEVDKYISNL